MTAPPLKLSSINSSIHLNRYLHRLIPSPTPMLGYPVFHMTSSRIQKLPSIIMVRFTKGILSTASITDSPSNIVVMPVQQNPNGLFHFQTSSLIGQICLPRIFFSPATLRLVPSFAHLHQEYNLRHQHPQILYRQLDFNFHVPHHSNLP